VGGDEEGGALLREEEEEVPEEAAGDRVDAAVGSSRKRMRGRWTSAGDGEPL
jgi:hypothetical protein